jgi:hypothetical protein
LKSRARTEHTKSDAKKVRKEVFKTESAMEIERLDSKMRGKNRAVEEMDER